MGQGESGVKRATQRPTTGTARGVLNPSENCSSSFHMTRPCVNDTTGRVGYSARAGGREPTTAVAAEQQAEERQKVEPGGVSRSREAAKGAAGRRAQGPEAPKVLRPYGRKENGTDNSGQEGEGPEMGQLQVEGLRKKPLNTRASPQPTPPTAPTLQGCQASAGGGLHLGNMQRLWCP